jgi:hypothetical protein
MMNQQFHQIFIPRGAGGLDDEDVHAADILLHLTKISRVGEAADGRFAQGHADLARDFFA